MRNLLIVILGLFAFLISCKKNNEKAFLTGQLVEDCNGIPVANKTIYLYQNYVPAPNFLLSDTKESIIETSQTDENGMFYFWAEDHTNDYTNSKANISIRLTDQELLVDGTMGNAKGKKSDQSLDFIQDVGEVYFQPSAVSFMVSTDTVFNGVSIDSIVFTGDQLEYITTTTNDSNGQFEFIYSSSYYLPIYFDPYDPENNGKHRAFISYSCYGNGDKLYYGKEFVYVNRCQPNQVISIKFTE